MTTGTETIAHDEEHIPEPLVTPEVRSGLETLWKAARYAHNAGVDPRDFAVELPEIRAAGLASSDLRWLIVKGYVDHACEIEPKSSERRSFESSHRFRFTASSCFVLTGLGIEFVRLVLLALPHTDNDHGGGCKDPLLEISARAVPATTMGDGNHQEDRPFWDSARRELWFDHALVKRFRVPAPRQEIILAVFQEEDWPSRIDDPLPPQPAIDPKRQLHAVISSLNRHRKHPLVHFSGDGTGTGVLWEASSNGEATP